MKLKPDTDKWVVKTHDEEFDINNFYEFKTEDDALAFILGEYVKDYWDHEVSCVYEENIRDVFHKITYDIDWRDES